MFIIVVCIFKFDSTNHSLGRKANFLKKEERIKYYNSLFLKIDEHINKAKSINDNSIEGKLIHYSKIFDNLLNIIYDYYLIENYKIDYDNSNVSNSNIINYLKDRHILKERLIDDLHYARKKFNLIKHDLDCEGIDEEIVISITNKLYNITKRIVYK